MVTACCVHVKMRCKRRSGVKLEEIVLFKYHTDLQVECLNTCSPTVSYTCVIKGSLNVDVLLRV